MNLQMTQTKINAVRTAFYSGASDAYADGYEAFEDAVTVCPQYSDGKARSAWRRGWEASRAASRHARKGK